MASAPSPFSVDPLNARKHGPRSREAVARSLRELGAGRSILVDRDGVVIAGNGVYEQAAFLGIPVRTIDTDGTELVVVVRRDLSPDDARRKALALADNRIGELSHWDEEKLAAARAGLDADLQAVASMPQAPLDLPPDSDFDAATGADGGTYRFSLGGFRAELAETTYRRIIDSIPGNIDPPAVIAELKRRIGL